MCIVTCPYRGANACSIVVMFVRAVEVGMSYKQEQRV
jgi:hypothetical protein